MLSIAVPGIGLVFFFYLVLYLCVRSGKQDADVPWDSNIETKRKSPFGR
jgi:hypothetical protein